MEEMLLGDVRPGNRYVIREISLGKGQAIDHDPQISKTVDKCPLSQLDNTNA